MANFRRILVPIGDLAGRASPALEKAAQLARALKAKVELFHDLAMTIPIEALGNGGLTLRSIKAEARRSAITSLEILAAPLRNRGLSVSTSVAWDYPSYEAIVRRGIATRADLIVVPQRLRHRGGPSLGYTDWELLRLSPIPLLLVKSATPYRRPTVLAAIDPTHQHAKPSALDQRILDCGAQLSTALRGGLHIVHAYVPVPLPQSVTYDPKLRKTLAAEAEREPRNVFSEALQKMTVPSSRRHLVSGQPVNVIEAVARQTHCAIAVLGAVSRSAVKRWFIGSTAEDVMDRLTCDMLVVKPARFAVAGARTRRGPKLISATLYQ